MCRARAAVVYLVRPKALRRVARCRLVTPVSRRSVESAAFARVFAPKPQQKETSLSRTCCRRKELTASASPAPRPVLLHLAAPRSVQSTRSARQEKEKKKSLQNPPTPPVSSRIRGINVEIVARRCSSTSEMKYLLLKVEKRCQTTIEKILKSIVDERRSPNLLAARIYARGLFATRRAGKDCGIGSAIRGCPCNRLPLQHGGRARA